MTKSVEKDIKELKQSETWNTHARAHTHTHLKQNSNRDENV